VRALITGAAGFCARHLALRLSQEPSAVIAGLDVAAPGQDDSFHDFFHSSVTDSGAVATAIRDFRPDLLVQRAGIGLGASKTYAQAQIYEVNAGGAVTVLDAVLRHVPDCAVLMTGSAAEYGPLPDEALPAAETAPCYPESAYAISKYAATLAALNLTRQHSLKVVIVRPFNIIGPGMPEGLLVSDLIARAARALKMAGPVVVEVGDLSSERDFVAIGDVVDAYVRLARGNFWGEIFNICSGKPYSVGTIAEMLFANSPRPIALVVNPSLVRPSAVRRLFGSYGKARRAIGFQPATSIEDALREIWESSFTVKACA